MGTRRRSRFLASTERANRISTVRAPHSQLSFGDTTMIEFNERPNPADRSRRYRLLVCRNRTGVGGIGLNPSFDWVCLHWLRVKGGKGRDVPCTRDASCLICPQRRYWKGFTAVLPNPGERVCVLQVTEGAWEQLEESKLDAINFRGRRLIVQREGSHAKDPLLFDVEALARDPLASVPHGVVNLKPFLLRLWGLDASHPSLGETSERNGNRISKTLFEQIPY